MKNVLIGYLLLSLLGIAVLGSFGVSCTERAGVSCCITEIFARTACPHESATAFINFHFGILKTFSFGIFHVSSLALFSFVGSLSLAFAFFSFANAKFIAAPALHYFRNSFDGVAHPRIVKLRWLAVREHSDPDAPFF